MEGCQYSVRALSGECYAPQSPNRNRWMAASVWAFVSETLAWVLVRVPQHYAGENGSGRWLQAPASFGWKPVRMLFFIHAHVLLSSWCYRWARLAGAIRARSRAIRARSAVRWTAPAGERSSDPSPLHGFFFLGFGTIVLEMVLGQIFNQN